MRPARALRLLAVDIGNTNTGCALFCGARLEARFSFPSHTLSRKQACAYLSRLAFDDAIIASVVPKYTKILEKTIEKITGTKPVVLGNNATVPIPNLYRRPSQVGQDRLVNAYAGLRLFAPPLIVVDFGTAVTFDVISSKGAYLGGIILPGLQLSLDALAERTALLPKIKLIKPKELIGTDTCASMLSGIVYGFAALTDSMIQKIKKRIGGKVKVIGTGGNIRLMQRYCKRLDIVAPDLTVQGLALIYEYRTGHKHNP